MRGTTKQVNEADSQTTSTLSATATWEQDTENTPVYAVVSAVAEADDSDPVDLPPLYDAINPDALNELFTSRSEPGVDQVTFRYVGYDVVVHGNGDVRVTPTQES